MYPVTARIFDFNFNRMMTKFFDMILLQGIDATAASTFHSVNNLIDQSDIQWSHCMGKGLENGIANVGEQNSIKS